MLLINKTLLRPTTDIHKTVEMFTERISNNLRREQSVIGDLHAKIRYIQENSFEVRTEKGTEIFNPIYMNSHLKKRFKKVNMDQFR